LHRDALFALCNKVKNVADSVFAEASMVCHNLFLSDQNGIIILGQTEKAG
jgi:hypothetical protein